MNAGTWNARHASSLDLGGMTAWAAAGLPVLASDGRPRTFA